MKALQEDSEFYLPSENCALEQNVIGCSKPVVTMNVRDGISAHISDEDLQVWNLFIQTSAQCKASPIFSSMYRSSHLQGHSHFVPLLI